MEHYFQSSSFWSLSTGSTRMKLNLVEEVVEMAELELKASMKDRPMKESTIRQSKDIKTTGLLI